MPSTKRLSTCACSAPPSSPLLAVPLVAGCRSGGGSKRPTGASASSAGLAADVTVDERARKTPTVALEKTADHRHRTVAKVDHRRATARWSRRPAGRRRLPAGRRHATARTWTRPSARRRADVHRRPGRSMHARPGHRAWSARRSAAGCWSRIPPADGFGSRRPAELGISRNDTLVFVARHRSRRTTPRQADGTPVASPTRACRPCTRTTARRPDRHHAERDAPAEQAGREAADRGQRARSVKARQRRRQYVGVVWAGRQDVRQLATPQGSPPTSPIGAGPGHQGLGPGPGRPEGRQPGPAGHPAGPGYGGPGQRAGGIKGTDTLVFVVDILDAS